MTKTTEEMLTACNGDFEHSAQVTEYSSKLFEALNNGITHFSDREKEYLIAASKLHDIGYFTGKKDHHKHTMNLILQEGLAGFDEEETRIIANIARYHRASLPDKERHEVYASLPKDKRKLVKQLASILKIADGLDKPHKNLILRIRAEETAETIDFYIKTVGFKPNFETAKNKKDLFEKTYKKQARFLLE